MRWKVWEIRGFNCEKKHWSCEQRSDRINLLLTGSLWLLLMKNTEKGARAGAGGSGNNSSKKLAGDGSEGGEKLCYFRGLSGEMCCQAACEVWQEKERVHGPPAFWRWHMNWTLHCTVMHLFLRIAYLGHVTLYWFFTYDNDKIFLLRT